MSATVPGASKRRNRSPGHGSDKFVLLATQVPPEVREHFRSAARRRGVSLSIYMEELAAVDPLASADDDDKEAAQKKTA